MLLLIVAAGCDGPSSQCEPERSDATQRFRAATSALGRCFGGIRSGDAGVEVGVLGEACVEPATETLKDVFAPRFPPKVMVRPATVEHWKAWVPHRGTLPGRFLSSTHFDEESNYMVLNLLLVEDLPRLEADMVGLNLDFDQFIIGVSGPACPLLP